MRRLMHLAVIGMLVFAAAYVYRIKLDSTVRTERVLKLQAEVREQRDAIASLRAEWARLDAPMRLQGLAERHLDLKSVAANQFDNIKNLPMRPSAEARSGEGDDGKSDAGARLRRSVDVASIQQAADQPLTPRLG